MNHKKSLIRQTLVMMFLISSFLFFNGCTTIEKNPEPVKEVKDYYDRIDLNNLTEKQKSYLEMFNEIEQEAITNNKPLLSEQDIKELKEDYPFIDPYNITDKDKIFLMWEFEESITAISAFSF
jgi:hypothetical protein